MVLSAGRAPATNSPNVMTPINSNPISVNDTIFFISELLVLCDYYFEISSSLISYEGFCAPAFTVRSPRPLYGAAASQGTGARFGAEPGAGNGNISDLAA